jgi:hypothetical protein
LVINNLRRLQHQLQRQIDVIHTDGAPELCKGLIKLWADQQGTVITTTVPNHSASNGLAERTIRTLQESTTVALDHANMTREYWDYTIEDAAAKHAVIPSDRSCNKEDPRTQFFQSQPDTNKFHPFGQYGYLTNSTTDRNPLRPRDVLSRYLRHINNHKFDVLQVHTGRVVTCRPQEFSPVSSLTQPTQKALSAATPAATDAASPTTPPSLYSPKSLKDALRRPDAAI